MWYRPPIREYPASHPVNASLESLRAGGQRCVRDFQRQGDLAISLNTLLQRRGSPITNISKYCPPKNNQNFQHIYNNLAVDKISLRSRLHPRLPRTQKKKPRVNIVTHERNSWPMGMRALSNPFTDGADYLSHHTADAPTLR